MIDRRIIYCDTDDVLVDKTGYIEANLPPGTKDNPAIMWPAIQAIPQFYRKLAPTAYARKLWAAIADTGLHRKILTAVPRVTTMPDAEADKNFWVDHHRNKVFGGERPEVLIGPHSKDKWKHARPGDLLVDDRIDNCVTWTTAGGVAIHHQGDVHRTIAMLKIAVIQGKQ